MGRMVSEQRIALQFDRQLNQGLVRSAAARASGLEYEEFDERLQRLLTLMPFLQDRLLRMSPKLLAALAADPSLVAARLIELKSLLPAAAVAAVAGGRPSLLLSPEWERLPAAAAALARRYSEEEVALLVAAEPLLLAEDVEAILAELQRLLPVEQPAAALLAQPNLASSVSRLSHLSLWLAGGRDAADMLLRDPGLVYSVQRGPASLGPGAEFM
ncbi:hypothetical protein ABPG75_006458 [Micractinium tetrahymenae]